MVADIRLIFALTMGEVGRKFREVLGNVLDGGN